MTASPITWFGSKSRLARRITALFPDHKTYVEPFGGSASVLLAKRSAPVEVYNDLHGDLVHLFRVLRDKEKASRLREVLELTPYAREEFDQARIHLEGEIDDIERARCFMIRQRQSHGGIGRQWSFCVDCSNAGMSSSVRRWRAGIDRLQEVVERFKRVQIENRHWLDLVEKYDTAETLFYLDPPYIPETRVDGGYQYEMDLQGHRDLVARIQGLRGKVLLSGYAHEAYGPLEAHGWKRVEWTVPVWTAHLVAGKRAQRTECLWISPNSLRASGEIKLDLAGSPQERMQEGARYAAAAKAQKTEVEILEAIRRLERIGQKANPSSVARELGISREHLSRRYRHLFEKCDVRVSESVMLGMGA